MSFFAVLSKGEVPDFDIPTCHINLWSLEGLFGRRTFVFDVGFVIKAHAKKRVREVQIALPFQTSAGALSDLKPIMLNKTVLDLIFGKEVSLEGEIVDYGQGNKHLSSINVTESKPIEGYSRKHFSLWTIRLGSEVRYRTERYFRMRFEVRNPGRMWIWNQSGLAKCGALVDFRASDIRGAWDVPDGMALVDRIVDISELFFFIISPSHLQMHVATPDLHYMRVLEGRVWEPYIGRATDLLRREKMIICEWRGSDIHPGKPLRCYFEARRNPEIVSINNHIRSAIVFITLLSLTIMATTLVDWQSIWNWIIVRWRALGITIVGLLSLRLISYIEFVQKLMAKTWKIFRAIENSIYRAIPHIF